MLAKRKIEPELGGWCQTCRTHYTYSVYVCIHIVLYVCIYRTIVYASPATPQGNSMYKLQTISSIKLHPRAVKMPGQEIQTPNAPHIHTSTLTCAVSGRR